MTELRSPVPHPDDPESSLVSRAVWQAELAHRNGIGHSALSNLLPPTTALTADNEQHALEALDKAAIRDKGAVGSLDFRMLSGELEWRAIDDLVTHGHDYEHPGVRRIAARQALYDPRVQEYMGSLDLDYMAPAHTKLVEAWPAFRQEFTQGVQHGISLGYFPDDLTARTQQALDATAIKADDLTLSWGEWRPRESSAVYDFIKDTAHLSEAEITRFGNVADLLAHEFVHKLAGGTFIAPRAGMNGFRRVRVGLASVKRNGFLSHAGLNEVVTELTKHGIMTGDFETINPDEQAEPATAYLSGLKVLDHFVAQSGGLVNVRQFTNALVEDTGPGGSMSARRGLVRGSVKAYGPAALEKLDLLCLYADTDVIAIPRHYISRIHPPEVAKDGTIIRQGWIDTEGLTLED